jgi:hypothetical protein
MEDGNFQLIDSQRNIKCSEANRKPSHDLSRKQSGNAPVVDASQQGWTGRTLGGEKSFDYTKLHGQPPDVC